MIKKRDIICISSIDWDFVWQGHQEIMSAFAKSGNRVLFIENTGIRAPQIKDIARLKRRVTNWKKGIKGIRQEGENLFILSPLILPFPYSKLAGIVNKFLFVNSIKSWMKAVDFQNPLIWTFLPTQISIDIIENIDNRLVVYYCIAEFSELAGSAKKVNKAEKTLLEKCDVVFAQGQKIKERCEKHNNNVHIFPFGVNESVFNGQNLLKGGTNDIDEIKQKHDVLVGYVGGIHKHVDIDMLKGLSDKIKKSGKNWAIVLVGPAQISLPDFRGTNIYLVGQKKLEELPLYISVFDICLIPYLINAYTKTVYPTKLNEYLAMKKPVISTALPEVKSFLKENPQTVEIISNSADELFNKVNEVIAKEKTLAQDKKHERRKAALKSSWPSRIEKMSKSMEAALEKRELKAVTRWKENFTQILRKDKRKILIAIGVLVAFYFILFQTPIIWQIAKPLEISTPLSKSDVIVVLGSGVGETGRGGQGYEERVKYASALYKEGYANKIIFSSGWVYAFREPDVMKALAILSGVPASAIMLEKESKNTYENVKNTLEIAEQNKFKKLIFISSPYHMRRLEMTADKLGNGQYVFLYSPVHETLFFGNKSKVLPRHIRAIFHEYLAILYYMIKGYA